MSSRNENVPEKSDFTRRCSLLSRYLKEKGSFGNIDLGLFRKPCPGLLLPGISHPSGPGKPSAAAQKVEHFQGEPSNSSGGKVKDADLSESHPGNSQLTIFFGGKVLVYNEFPADKAQEIMDVAKLAKPVTEINIQTQINAQENNNNNKSNIQTQTNVEDINNNDTSDMVLPDLNEPTNSAYTDHNHPTKEQQQQNQIVERIARRASLHRFFAKRKDRAVARAPYQVNQNPGHHRYPPKPETVADQPLELGQSSQRTNNAVAQTVAHPKSDGDKDVTMEIEEGQSSKDLDLKL
ncbi:protein TIFY 11A [Capsella rubella]|nr:protein TIFY 11A [Capsella rubella]